MYTFQHHQVQAVEFLSDNNSISLYVAHLTHKTFSYNMQTAQFGLAIQFLSYGVQVVMIVFTDLPKHTKDSYLLPSSNQCCFIQLSAGFLACYDVKISLPVRHS